MNLRTGEDTRIWKRRLWIAPCGGIVLEEALDLSSDSILNNNYCIYYNNTRILDHIKSVTKFVASGVTLLRDPWVSCRDTKRHSVGCVPFHRSTRSLLWSGPNFLSFGVEKFCFLSCKKSLSEAEVFISWLMWINEEGRTRRRIIGDCGRIIFERKERVL